MKKFLKALLSLTLFTSALAAVVYFLQRKGILKIELETAPVELQEITRAPEGKTVFRSEQIEKLEREEANTPPAFDFEFTKVDE